MQYSTDPTFTANVVSRNVKKTASKLTLKLQKKVVYYVRIRYVGVSGVSNWSGVKRVRTKK